MRSVAIVPTYNEADNIEANQGDKGPPTPEYLAAYRRMRTMMGLQ